MDKRRILVVDDEQKIRSLVASYLRSDGFEVVEAGRSRRLDASAPYRSRRVFASVFGADSSAFGMAAGHRAY